MKSKEQKRLEALLRDYTYLRNHVNKVAGIEDLPASLKGCIAYVEDGNCDIYSERTLQRIRQVESKFPDIARQAASVLKTDNIV